jgi:hypothetical protein
MFATPRRALDLRGLVVPLVGYSFPEFRSADADVGAFFAGEINQEIVAARFRVP